MVERKSFVIPKQTERGRADKVLSSLSELNKSRSSIAQLIKAGCFRCNAQEIRPSTILGPGDEIDFFELDDSEPVPASQHCVHVPVIFENADILVIDKPCGLVTHPGAGRQQETLVDIVLKIRPEIEGVGVEGRWGIVHRLDKDTSGVMVIAKTDSAHKLLSLQFREHGIHRSYRAIVRGNPGSDSGIINYPIGRDSKDRKKMTTRPLKGRIAESHWRVLERFQGFSLLEIRPKTGRTHQIRAHLAAVNMPVLGDRIYGAPTKKQIRLDKTLARLLNMISRQALHAAELGISLDPQKETLFFCSDLPKDMLDALETLRSSGSTGALFPQDHRCNR